MNNFIFIGRITQNLELRKTANDKSVCEISIAVNNTKDDTTFVKVTTFGAIADSIHKYCKKGDLIATTGLVKNHNWEDKNGNKRYDFSFIATKVTFLQQKSKEKEENKSVDSIKRDEIVLSDEDLPF